MGVSHALPYLAIELIDAVKHHGLVVRSVGHVSDGAHQAFDIAAVASVHQLFGDSIDATLIGLDAVQISDVADDVSIGFDLAAPWHERKDVFVYLHFPVCADEEVRDVLRSEHLALGQERLDGIAVGIGVEHLRSQLMHPYSVSLVGADAHDDGIRFGRSRILVHASHDDIVLVERIENHVLCDIVIDERFVDSLGIDAELFEHRHHDRVRAAKHHRQRARRKRDLIRLHRHAIIHPVRIGDEVLVQGSAGDVFLSLVLVRSRYSAVAALGFIEMRRARYGSLLDIHIRLRIRNGRIGWVSYIGLLPRTFRALRHLYVLCHAAGRNGLRHGLAFVALLRNQLFPMRGGIRPKILQFISAKRLTLLGLLLRRILLRQRLFLFNLCIAILKIVIYIRFLRLSNSHRAGRQQSLAHGFARALRPILPAFGRSVLRLAFRLRLHLLPRLPLRLLTVGAFLFYLRPNLLRRFPQLKIAR